MPAPQPTDRDVLALAKWLVDTHRRLELAEGRQEKDIAPPWRKSSQLNRDALARVARALLTDPPRAVRRAVRRMEGD